MSATSDESPVAQRAPTGPAPARTARTDAPLAAQPASVPDERLTSGGKDQAARKPRRLWPPVGGSDANDIMCVKVVCNAGAHVAVGRKRVALLQTAVNTFNEETDAPFITDVKHISDRYKLLMDQFERENKDRERKRGEEEQLLLSELDQLLKNALEDKEKWMDAREAAEEAKDKKEARLRLQGRALNRATAC